MGLSVVVRKPGNPILHKAATEYLMRSKRNVLSRHIASSDQVTRIDLKHVLQDSILFCRDPECLPATSRLPAPTSPLLRVKTNC
jgi:hypothetical protein